MKTEIWRIHICPVCKHKYTDTPYHSPITHLGPIPPRMLRALIDAGIYTIGTLTSLSETEILKRRNIGKVTYTTVMKLLEEWKAKMGFQK